MSGDVYDPSFDMAGFQRVYDAYVQASASTSSPDIDAAFDCARELERRAGKARAYWQEKKLLRAARAMLDKAFGGRE